MLKEVASPEPRNENGSRLSNDTIDSKGNKPVDDTGFEYFLRRFRELSQEYQDGIPLAPVVWGVFTEKSIEKEEARQILWRMEKMGKIKVDWRLCVPVLLLVAESRELDTTLGHTCSGCARLPSCERARDGEPAGGCYQYGPEGDEP